MFDPQKDEAGEMLDGETFKDTLFKYFIVTINFYLKLININLILFFRRERARLNMSTENVKKFKVVSTRHNPQIDGVNCGVHFIEV